MPTRSHRRPRRLRRPLAGLLCGLVLAGGTATALTPGLTGATASADGGGSAGAPGKLVLVMDSSGSMKEPATGGETKIAAAKSALRTVISDLPSDQPVGLRVYGARVFSRSQPGACTDSQLEVPVAAGNRDRLLAAVGSYRPYGETPIGYALQQAAKDLGTTGKRSIVLVSDGVPTCAPDPCKVAAQLAKSGVDLKIDVVGLDVDSRARGALQCIAAAGRGTYYDVAGSRDFAASLQKVATRAARPYATIGQPVTGGHSADDAATVTNGDWLDHTDGTRDRYYTIERSQPGSTVHFSAAFRDPDTTVFNRVQLSTPDGEVCSASGDVEQLAVNAIVSSAAVAGPVGTSTTADPSSACATSPTLVAKVDYSGRSVGVPVEIRVLELPKVDNLSSLPAPVKQPRWVAPPNGSPRPVQGGTSFDDAPLVTSGSYRDSIVQGETLTYRVDLDWGQQLTAATRFPALTGPSEQAVEGDPLVRLSVFGPARARAGSGIVGKHLAATFLRKGAAAELGTVTGPVAFRNSSATDPAVGGADVAGRYTVTLFVAKKTAGRSVPIRFRLDLGVSGTARGAPAFASPAPSPDSSASASDSPSPGASDDPTDSSAGAASDSSEDGGPSAGTVLAVLGAAALVAAGALTVRSVRRQA